MASLTQDQIDLILAFHGFEAPTLMIGDKRACGLAIHRIVDCREKGPEQLLFAYPDQGVWKTILLAAEPGRYRVALVGRDLHCSKVISIDAGNLAEGQLQIDFRREDCRRALIPSGWKEPWRRLRAFLEKRRDDPRYDERALARSRRRYRRGPIGAWISSHDMLTVYGCSIEFRKDLTGTVVSWGQWGEEDPCRAFLWRPIGDFAVDLQPASGDGPGEDWGVVEYDFKVARSAYGSRQILMYSTNWSGHDPDNSGFWWSPHPMVASW